ncbi:NADP-dependent oxidoreductase [Flectobacillus major]|uniref:NADP-dependent oxidoreductase n=1 Tax=Flectobacillus major TaxID=103 RepID=UPI00041D7D20|nr:NADP-dependent oxidoreductase [Flectobacillus major]
MTNTQVKLAARPVGNPQSTDFLLESSPVPTPQEGEVLVKTLFVSMDPAMRGWMNEGKSYIRPIQIGEVFRAGTAGKIVVSKNPNFEVGDYVTGNWGVQEYAVSLGKDLVKVDISIAPLTTYLATLGMPGLTAYFGLLDTALPKAGETLVVSGASGAVGSVVGQIAKIKGCKVVGIAGEQDKCDYCITELGFDACINYKTQDVRKALKEACPEGIDIYFDNVGGEILDIVLGQIRFKARIVICGAISQYNNTTPIKGPSNYLSLLVNRAKMEGIVVFDNAHRYGEAAKEMAMWIQQGKLKSKVHIEKGLDNFLPTMMMLFSGKNFGKLLLQVGEE